MNNRRSMKYMSTSNRIFYIFNAIFWAVMMFIVIYPLYLVCIASISNPDAVINGKVIWRPVDVDFIGYKMILRNKELWISYVNSIFYTIAGVGISIVVTLMGAYALSRKEMPGRSLISLYIIIPMFFSGGLIPTFLTLKNLGFYNSRWIIILMGCVSVWNLMVARTYIQSTLPEELREAAVLDGASHFQYFFRIVFPLSKTIVAVLAIYYGVAKWNDYFTGLIYIKDEYKMPLQTVLREIVAVLQIDMASIKELMSDPIFAKMLGQAAQVAQSVKYCAIVVSTVPIMLLYIILQKYFEKGVMIGSLKG